MSIDEVRTFSKVIKSSDIKAFDDFVQEVYLYNGGIGYFVSKRRIWTESCFILQPLGNATSNGMMTHIMAIVECGKFPID
ncbi:MAG: hypothetical protein KAJ58_00435 [Candidatus Pacebacteria bacterium]|nr:hypothetical protein [Candidatus Paceibacterota bacterium]